MSLTNFDLTETFAAGTTEWTKQSNMPTARGGIAATAHGPNVFIFGGEAGEGTFDEAEAFDVTTGQWTSYPLMPTSRHGLCAVTIENHIHVIGGGPQPGLSVSGVHEVLELG